MKDFICKICGRQQSYKPENQSGGVTNDEAHQVGWASTENNETWICPFCSGNEHKLNEVFNQ